jgi:hypothetical protein
MVMSKKTTGIDMFKCHHCQANVTDTVTRNVIHVAAQDDVSAGEKTAVPVACAQCGATMILSVTFRVVVIDAVALRKVPGVPQEAVPLPTE